VIYISLKTFRETSCVFYLTVASFVNIFELVTGLLFRILNFAYNIDITKYSVIVCKARISILRTAALISLTCICLQQPINMLLSPFNSFFLVINV
jgi:hypothetical protein